MKDRVTLTIDKSILKQIDNSVDGTNVKNRSHAVELLLAKSLKGDLPEQAVVLGGATHEHVQDVLKNVNGKTVLEHNIEMLADSGIKQIIIITADPELLRTRLSRNELHVNLHFIKEVNPLGTAGSLHLAKPYLQDTFILLNGDELKDISIRDMFSFHRDHQGSCTLALTTVSDPSEYGVALLNGNRIITFVEKPNPKNAPSNLISAGFYIMNPEVLDLIPNGYANMENDIFPKLAREDKLFGYPFSGQYFDLSSIDSKEVEESWIKSV